MDGIPIIKLNMQNDAGILSNIVYITIVCNILSVLLTDCGHPEYVGHIYRDVSNNFLFLHKNYF